MSEEWTRHAEELEALLAQMESGHDFPSMHYLPEGDRELAQTLVKLAEGITPDPAFPGELETRLRALHSSGATPSTEATPSTKAAPHHTGTSRGAGTPG